MNPILDRFTPSKPASSTFRPSSRQELFALRVAAKLNDAVAANHYAVLLSECSEGQMLCALRHALKSSSGANLAKNFHMELRRFHGNGSHGNGSNGKSARLIAVRVERRSVAVAVFYGDHLEYADVRHLSSTKDKALESAIAFIEWIADQFPVDSAALELIPNGNEIQRRIISTAIIDSLRARLMSIWEIEKSDLFQAFGYPPLKSRKELRAVVGDILLSLENVKSNILIKDAVALGLHVQTERSFLS